MKKPYIFFLLFTALFFLAFNVSAQDSLNVQIRRSNAVPFSDKVGYTVNLYVSVTENSGKPHRGLDAENFKVYEDSVPQTLIEARSAEDEAVSVALLMDMSGSMLGQSLYDPQSIANFLRMLGRNDQSAIISFNDRISILQRFTSDHVASINTALSAKPENGRGTCLYDAIYEGLELTLSQPSGRRAVVIFTDGVDELPDGGVCSSKPLSDVLNFSIENRVPVFTIGIGDNIDEKELQRIAETTGGSFTEVTPYVNMDSVFNTIYSQLYHEYKLSYKSENTVGNHVVLVEAEKNGAFGKNSGVVSLPVMPTIMRFQSPEEGSAQQGEALLSVAFISQNSEVANVEYFCNGQQLGKVINFPYTFSWDISHMEPGIAIVDAIAYGKDNRELARASRMLFIQEMPTAEVTQEPTAVPTAVPTQTPLPVKETASGTNSFLLISLGGLSTAVIILVILLSRRKTKHETETPVYIPPINYAVYNEPAAAPTSAHRTPANRDVPLATLEVIHSDDQSMIGSIFKVDSLPLTLGRNPDNNVVFTQLDRAVGRHHAVLEEKNGQITIRDLNSRYGTYINEQRSGADPVVLNNGDAIRLGSRMTLKFSRMLTPVSGRDADTTAIFDNSSLDGEETLINHKVPEDSEKTVKIVVLGKNKK